MFISKTLIALSKGSRGILFIRCLLDVMQNGLALFRALMLSRLLSILLSKNVLRTQHIVIYSLVLCITIIAEASMSCLIQYVGTVSGTRIKNQIRNQMMDDILDLGPAYVQKQRSGSILTAMIGKVESMEPYYTSYLPNAISAVFWMTIVIIWFYTVNRLIALTCLAGILIVLFLPNIWSSLMSAYGKEDWSLFTEFQAEMMDNLQGMPTLKLFNASEQRGKRLETLAWNIHTATMKNLSVSQIESGVLIFGAAFGSTIPVYIALCQALKGNITSSELITIMFLASACFVPVFTLIDTWHLGYHGLTAAPDVLALLKDGKEYRAGKDKTPEETVPHVLKYTSPIRIFFDHVDFGYTTQSPVLNDLSLELLPGKKTALVGPSGSGKSTLIHLLAGFYQPWNGHIFVNERELNIHLLRQNMGVVWQEPYLFYGSIYENICMGTAGACEKDVETAAKMANIHDFITHLPDRYQTLVGERGIRLSGGEKQRIAIARCFLRQPHFLIFDEATSSLDRENEEAIRKSEELLLAGRTSLIAAHRLSTIQNADIIYVLEGGRIVQSGTHEELISQEGVYRKLMLKQME